MGRMIPCRSSRMRVRRVSSAAIRSTSARTRSARSVTSSRFPIGVATTYSVPRPGTSLSGVEAAGDPGGVQQPLEVEYQDEVRDREDPDRAEIADGTERQHGVFRSRRIEEHHLHDARIVIERDDAVHEPDQHERILPALDAGREDVELAEEAGERRQPGEGEEE